jgi:esterase
MPDRAIRGFLLQNLMLDAASGRVRWRCNLDALSDGMADIIGFPEDLLGMAYLAPTFFLTGADSNYVRHEQRPLIKGLFPSAQFAALKDAGHSLHAVRPRPFMGAVRALAAGY